MRVYIVEDDAILLQHLKILLNGEYNLEVVGSAIYAEDALEAIPLLNIDVLITDLRLLSMQGIEFIKKTKSIDNSIEIIVHSIAEDNEMIFQAIHAGASGYILKGSTPRELVESINDIYRGGAPMSPRIARKVIVAMQDTQIENQYLLTPKELSVLKLIEKGMSYIECATELCVSKHTINSHIKKIYQKLHVQNRTDALKRARKKGII